MPSWQTVANVARPIRFLDNLDLASLPITASVGDPDGTRTITSIVALLIALGLALLMVAIWMWRTTRPDPEFLAPLEAMGERRWRRGDPVWQRRRLDELRPDGAEPLVVSAAPPEIDESFEAGPSVSGFDDLEGDRLVPPLPARPTSQAEALEPPTGQPVGSWTPDSLKRPTIDELPSGEIDADAIAAAMAELDAELAGDELAGDEQPAGE